MDDKAQVFLRNPKLLKALQAEEEAFSEASRGAHRSNYKNDFKNNMNSQDWFRRLAEFLQEYENSEYRDFPRGAEVFGRMRRLMESFAAGKIPDPVLLATSKDGGAWWPGERADIAIAVYYAQAAKAGEIKDGKYNKTIRELYEVQDRTVRRWIKDADSICDGINRPDISHLSDTLQTCGRRYAQSRTGRKAADE